MQFVPMTDIAAAVLRGLTADEPEAMDPVLDCVFHSGVYEQVWWGLQEEPPHEGVMRCDRWGVGPLKAWDGRIRFEADGFDETVPHESVEGTAEEYASLCETWGSPGHIGEDSSGLLRAFRDALQLARSLDHDKRAKARKAAADRASKEAAAKATAEAEEQGKDPKEAAKDARKKVLDEAEEAELQLKKAAEAEPDAFETSQKELLASSQASPRKLVSKAQPCPGLLASYARYSPEVGDASECGCVFLNVFEQGFSPWNNYQNTVMVCAAAPDPVAHHMTPRSFLCALRAVGSNISRAVREYNRLSAGHEAPNALEHTTWLRADLRAQVESFLSEINTWSDPNFAQAMWTADDDGWMGLDIMKGKTTDAQSDAEYLDALNDSTYVETKIKEDGKVLVRRPDLQLQS